MGDFIRKLTNSFINGFQEWGNLSCSQHGWSIWICVDYVGRTFYESGGNITSGYGDGIDGKDGKDYAQIECVSDLVNSDSDSDGSESVSHACV
jgi:hypothetical protein